MLTLRAAALLLVACLSVSGVAAQGAKPGATTPGVEAAIPSPGGVPAEPAPQRTVESSATLLEPAAGVHDLSPWSMFLGADVLVKVVMVGLACASLVTWTIFLAKLAELGIAKRRLGRALLRLSTCRSLPDAAELLGRDRNVLAILVRETAGEVRLSSGIANLSGLRERVQSVHADVLRQEGRGVRLGLGLLATIGSISPFVGLFGTVWGIMNAFIGISKAQTTNLAVVAPGIAEALLATAIGLVAAIPAVIIYNHFARATRSYLDLASRASSAVTRLLSRDLDRAGAEPLALAAE